MPIKRSNEDANKEAQQKGRQRALHGGHVAAVFASVRIARALRVLLVQLA